MTWLDPIQRHGTMQLRHFLLLLAASYPAAHARGQSDTPTQHLRDAIGIEQAGDSVTAGGWDYHAAIGPDRTRFVPALGRRATTTQHLDLQPISFGRASGAATPARIAPAVAIGERVEIARGAGATERFAVTPHGLELSWRFDAPPPGHGDLVVRYRLASNLPERQVDHTGLHLTLPDVGGVSIGTVSGVDALGNTTPGTLHVDDDVLELRLPASFVDRCAYPLVLDPLIGTQLLGTTNQAWDDGAPDVAYSGFQNTYLVVYRRRFSSLLVGIRAQRVQGDGTLVGSFISLGNSPDVGPPSAAATRQGRDFLVTWHEAPSLFDDRNIVCRSIDATTGAATLPVTVAGTAAEELDPDAAGNTLGAGQDVLIVYTLQGAGVRLARVDVAGGGALPVVTGTTMVDTTASAKWPAISKSPFGLDVAVITYHDLVITSPAIRARACDANGALLGNALTIATGALLSPPERSDVDGDGTDFVVVYEARESGVGYMETDVYARPIRWNGSALQNVAPAVPIADIPGIDEGEPAIAFCEHKFILAFSRQVITGSFNYDVQTVEFDHSCAPCGPRVTLGGLNTTVLRNREFAPAIAGRVSSGFPGDDALVVFAEADDAPPFSGSIVMQRMTALAGEAPGVLGPGCGENTALNPLQGGPFAPGNEDHFLGLGGLPSGTLPILLLALPGPTQSCGPCTYITPLATVFTPQVGSSARYAWPMPCSTSPFVGSEFDVQWVLLNTSASPCAAFANISFSERVRLTLRF